MIEVECEQYSDAWYRARIDAIMSDVCDLPGNYDPADPNVVMMTLDELHAILESHLSKE